MEQSKLSAMMEGKTFTKENVDQMVGMVESASGPEDKTNVMKHSVFFAGQLPLTDQGAVDIEGTRRMMGAEIPESSLDETLSRMLDALATQKLLLKQEDGSYILNSRYDKSIAKVRKIARAWQMEREQIPEDLLARVKKMYQTGTKYYHDGSYEEAFAAFMNTVEMAGYRMGYYSLALMYRDGKGVEASTEQALLCARAAIARGAKIAEALEEELLGQI